MAYCHSSCCALTILHVIAILHAFCRLNCTMRNIYDKLFKKSRFILAVLSSHQTSKIFSPCFQEKWRTLMAFRAKLANQPPSDAEATAVP